jgi:hypothetical protein
MIFVPTRRSASSRSQPFAPPEPCASEATSVALRLCSRSCPTPDTTVSRPSAACDRPESGRPDRAEGGRHAGWHRREQNAAAATYGPYCSKRPGWNFWIWLRLAGVVAIVVGGAATIVTGWPDARSNQG